VKVPALVPTYDPRDGVPPSCQLNVSTEPQTGATAPRHENQKVEVDIVSVNIKPLEDRIVVKALEAEQTTASGLVIPDTAKEKPQEGEVVAIGPGRIDDNGNRVPLDVSVGDKVIYSKYGGTEVKYSGEEFLILSARDVLAAPPPPRDRLSLKGRQRCPRFFRSTRTPVVPWSGVSTSLRTR
jgi:chaperonin GroES